jgi:hypothetical protein
VCDVLGVWSCAWGCMMAIRVDKWAMDGAERCESIVIMSIQAIRHI